ncbi:GumC family protein [Humitalea sp. 24SJ18S-53]|uniref:GumC family protein n=1 Tax=Humitalea sp. 24SJ18S-53 TaxID=3422307 RepID=UPI003D67014C
MSGGGLRQQPPPSSDLAPTRRTIDIDAPIGLPGVSLHDILRTLLRRRWPMVGIMLGAVLCSLVYLFLESPSYVSSTRVLVRVGREKLSSVSIPQISAGNFMFSERPENVNDEVEIMRSPAVMQRAYPLLRERLEEMAAAAPPPSPLRRLINQAKGIARDAAKLAQWPLRVITGRRDLSPEEALYETISRSLVAAPVRETNVFGVGFGWAEPHFAAFALNTILDAFIQEHIRVQSSAAQAVEFYREREAGAVAELAEVDAGIEAAARTAGIADPGAEKQVIISLITTLERDISQARISEDQTRRRAAELRTQVETGQDWPATPGVPQVQLTQLADIDARYAEISGRRNAALTQLRPTSREVRDLDQQIANLRRQKYAALIGYLDDRIATEQQVQVAAQTRLVETHARQARLQAIEARFIATQSRRDQLLQRIREYRQQIDHMQMLRAMDSDDQTSVRILSPALPPLLPSWPRATLLLGLALGCGLLLAIAYAVFAEFFDRTVSTERDAERVLGLPVLARVPEMRR